ncbi:MAG: hypothetical protein KC684_10300, partial [Candidatus Omnitrophica bacterium]|nr:hypothetical protein [Candidatus Omnitrophota bacterium]
LDIYPYGNFLVPIFYVLLSYALVYHQYLDITLALKKGIVYVILIVIISTIYVLSVFMLQPYFETVFGRGSNMSGMMAALLLGIIFAPMRLRLEQLFDSTIFRSYNDKIAREKQLMEYELVRSEKFKTVSNITKGIIKEIQTPLAAIKTCSQVNRQNIENEEVLRNSAQKIDQQVDHINTLLHQLLKFSNPSSPKTEQANIYDVLEDVFGILKHKMTENNIQLETHFNTKDSILLKIDPTQVRQTICNIIINAIEAMPDGGSLSITTSITKSSDTPGTVVGDFFEIDITDTGRGIPPEGLKNVFDPFYSPTAKRAGLGLSIAHRIIKEHKGHIKVKSELNKGSSFIIMLPVTVMTRT